MSDRVPGGRQSIGKKKKGSGKEKNLKINTKLFNAIYDIKEIFDKIRYTTDIVLFHCVSITLFKKTRSFCCFY
jgi:hypothetical protein